MKIPFGTVLEPYFYEKSNFVIDTLPQLCYTGFRDFAGGCFKYPIYP